MDDYISRQVALNLLTKWADGYNYIEVETQSAINEFEQLPSVDAVEVVRCKDCKHRYIDGENVRYNVCDLNHNKVQGDDWYCADGERKPDETN